MNLKGKRVLITGATSGLGNSLSAILAKEGARIGICARNARKLAEVKETIVAEGASCLSAAADVGKRSDVESLVEMIHREWGGLDAVVNNAGAAHPLKSVVDITDGELTDCFRSNVFSIFYMMKSVVPIMRGQGGGTIVNISSMCGRRGSRNLGAYCSSKFAVRGVTEVSARDLLEHNIRCISVSPSGMNTRMRAGLFGEEEARGQQEPGVVASVVRDIMAGEIDVPTGADVVVRRGKVSVIPPEEW